MHLLKIHFRFMSRLQKQCSCKILLIKHMYSSKAKLCKTTHLVRFGDIVGILMSTKRRERQPQFTVQRAAYLQKLQDTLLTSMSITVHTIATTLLEKNERFPFCTGDNCDKRTCKSSPVVAWVEKKHTLISGECCSCWELGLFGLDIIFLFCFLFSQGYVWYLEKFQESHFLPYFSL